MRRWMKRAILGGTALAALMSIAWFAARPSVLDRVWVRFDDRAVARIAEEPEGADLQPSRCWLVEHCGPSSLRGPEPELLFVSPASGWLQDLVQRTSFPHARATYWKSGRAASGPAGTWFEYGRIVGDYWQTVGDPNTSEFHMVTMLADGSIAGTSGATWRRERRLLRLTWPDPKAPGGAWLDECTLSVDETTYEGTNQLGVRISGSFPIGD